MVDTNNYINDKRNIKDFKSHSFSKFKKTDVCKELITCINNQNIESACNWCAELICAGQFQDLWEVILISISKYIAISNPKLPIYISKKFYEFKDIITNGYIGSELLLRNNMQIRQLFAEIVTILSMSNKTPGFEPIKIKSNDEFLLQHISNKLKADNMDYAKCVWRENDAKEIYIAINEIAYYLNKKHNLRDCCYWIEWIMELDAKCRKKKQNIINECRTFAPVDNKFQNDVIWIVWELIIYNNNNTIIKKILESLLELFGIRYTYAIKKKRRYLLYFALQLIIQQSNLSISIAEPNTIDNCNIMLKNINQIYKKIKTNEQSPNTEYLEKDIKHVKSNIEKSLEKIKIIGNL